ncbi:MFS transporter [Pseudonocardiaceae bacterium YIM PH 21723]|nr:MFS transporter [Pseudonocardiaceae bacterium YIM PH 21723]
MDVSTIDDVAVVAEREADSARGWPTVFALAAGAFCFVFTEHIHDTTLERLAEKAMMSTATGALTITMFGLLAGLGAPFFVAASRRIDRRVLVGLLLGTYLTGFVISSSAETFGVLVAGRLILGLANGLLWSVTTSIALRQVAPRHWTKVTILVFAAVGSAAVLCVPLGDLAGGPLNTWELGFLVTAVIGVLTMSTTRSLLPSRLRGGPQSVASGRDLPVDNPS